MAVPTVISGKDVLINGVTGMTQLKLTKNVPNNTFSHAGTSGGTQTLLGVPNYTWSASGVGYEPGLFPSATGVSKSLTFFYTTPDKLSYSGTLFTSQLTITGDRANKQNPWSWTASGAFSGAVSKVSTGNQDVGGYAAESSAYVDIIYGGSTPLDTCLQSVSMQFNCPLAQYNCAGVAYQLGGNLTASLTVNLLENDASDVFTSADSIRVQVNGAEDGWDFNYIKWATQDGPSGDRSTNAAVSMSVTGHWSIEEDGGIRSPASVVHIGAFT